jgi:catechol 2,3-dioxygenase-like lactoylglutathione lyase family enzyme
MPSDQSVAALASIACRPGSDDPRRDMDSEGPAGSSSRQPPTVELGAFSVSLSVADLARSVDFYGKLGFQPTGGNPQEGWLILANGTTLLGLFQGMFEGNILTFNPGLTNDQKVLSEFTDIRQVQQELQDGGLELVEEADADGTGPAHITLVDPDGNNILIDQHVPRPEN